MRTSLTGITAVLLFIPALVSAAAFGFPRQPLWVSATSAQAGESITMYAAVYNATNAEMKGTVSFLADGTAFDTKDVDLAPGGSSLVTSAWNSTQGSHALSASFVSGTQKDATDKITVTISAPPPPPPPAPPSVVDQAISQTTNITQTLAASSSPVTKIANAVLDQTEKLRTAGSDFLTPYATDGNTVSSTSKNSHATSSLSSTFTSSSAKSGNSSVLHAGIQTAAAAALFAFNTKWLFYILFILLLFFILRAIKRWVNRPRF